MSKYAELFRQAGGSSPGLTPEGVPEERREEREDFTLLFVDDEPGVLEALRRIFLEESYTVLTAPSAEKALEILSGRRVHLIVSDHRMPGMTGAKLLREIKERWPDTIRIMLTGYADIQSIMGAVNEGAVYKFITKPWNNEDLRLTVSLALQQYVLLQENRRLKELTKRQQLKIKSYSALVDENRVVLGNILLKEGAVARDQIDEARKAQVSGETLIEALVRLDMASETRIAKALQRNLGIDLVDLNESAVNPEVARFLPRDFCEKNRLIPIRLDNRRITIAMADPSDIFKCDNIALMTGFAVVPVVARNSDILLLLKKVHGEKGPDAALLDGLPDREPFEEIDIVIEELEETGVDIQELVSSSKVPPIIRIVNSIISEAIRYRASDIHVEPKTKFTLVRYRIDGILHAKIHIPAELHPAVVSRVKILAKMDIAERRKPQDGRITVRSGARIVDIRVSSMPTINGEKVVMRILDKKAAIRRIEELGVLPEDLEKIDSLIRKPQGIIVSTGPTGSGKTTTLYSILNAMLEGSRSFETIEDPVEYFLEEANQVYIQDKAGLTFASVLRATVRQDPDVILVGEMRDFETADVAFKASLTGHMVLTTLHTNNSVASITRMIDMGVKPYLIASALEGILAQRLVRRICRHCRTPGEPDGKLMASLRVPPERLDGTIYRGTGCERCNATGFQGRIGLFELFLMNDDFRHFICGHYKESELFNMARAAGMRTLVEDGIEKVRRGDTTLEELLRVVGPQTRHERTCGRCVRTIDAKFLFCPYCGAFKRNCCASCSAPLEEDWIHCPLCGKAHVSDPQIPTEER
jgi:type II secretory ATPase GspE/PulE/Tfp pilus assembly ATPase PilB-like protein/FixJ family two-component response regulator